MRFSDFPAAPAMINVLILALAVQLAFGLLEVRRGAEPSKLLRSVGLLTGLVLCPVVIGILLGPASSRSVMSAWKSLFWFDRGPLPASLVTGCWASVITLFVATIRLAPNWIWQGYEKLLTPVTEGPLFESVQRIASAQRLVPPSLSIVRGHHALENNAIALGLARPQVVVGQQLDTVLKPAEMDFLIGHELRHHANGTLFWQVAVWAFAGTVTAIIGTFSPSTPILLIPLLAFGLGRIVSRRLEFDCDRAGLAFSNVAAATSALRVIVAGTVFGDFNRWQALSDAMMTHPSLAARIAAIHGDNDAEQLSLGASLSLQRRLGWAAVLGFLGLAAVAVAGALLDRREWLIGATVCVIAVPVLAAFAAARLGLKTQQILNQGVAPNPRSHPVGTLLVIAVVGVATGTALAMSFADSGAPSESQLLLGCGVLLVTIVSLFSAVGLMIYRERLIRRRWVKESSIAIANAEYPVALDLLTKAKTPRALEVMHAVLTISALKGTGRDDDALARARQLVATQPDVVRAHLLRGFLSLECDLIDEAVAASAEIVRLVPTFSIGLAFRGSVLAKIKNLDEAAEVADRLRLVDRRTADVLACEVAIARDDLQASHNLLQKIDSHSPGQISGTLLRLDLALAEDNEDAAVDAAQTFLNYAEKQPNQWLDRRALRAAEKVTALAGDRLTVPARLATLPPLGIDGTQPPKAGSSLTDSELATESIDEHAPDDAAGSLSLPDA